MKNNPTWDTPKSKDLWKAILLLKNIDECRRFFRDLMTPEEIASIADRWQMAKLLEKGMPQREIAKKLNVSIATVTRVNQWRRGEMGGYRIILDRMKK